MIYISVFDDFNYHAIRMKKCSVVKKEVCPICARYEKGWEFDTRFTNKILNAQLSGDTRSPLRVLCLVHKYAAKLYYFYSNVDNTCSSSHFVNF